MQVLVEKCDVVGYGEYRAQARAGRERHDRNTEVQLCTRNDVLFFLIFSLLVCVTVIPVILEFT